MEPEDIVQLITKKLKCQRDGGDVSRGRTTTENTYRDQSDAKSRGRA